MAVARATLSSCAGLAAVNRHTHAHTLTSASTTDGCGSMAHSPVLPTHTKVHIEIPYAQQKQIRLYICMQRLTHTHTSAERTLLSVT